MLSNKWYFNGILVIYFAYIVYMVSGDTYLECIGSEINKKFVVSHENCARYIYCDGDNSFDGECLGEYYFNVNEGKCDERSAVVCNIVVVESSTVSAVVAVSPGAADNPSKPSASEGNEVLPLDGGRGEQNFSSTTSIKNTSNNKNKTNTNNINKFNKNNNLTNIITGQQQVKYQTTKSPAHPEVVTGLALSAVDMGNSYANIATFAQPPKCPVRNGTQNLIYLPNTQSCSSYYMCYNGIAIPMICSRNSYFVQATSRCERQANYYCPYDRQVRLICNPGVFDYIPHSSNCSYYYYCSNGYLIILQCPFQFTWHYERRSCVHRSQAKCFTSAVAQAMLN